MHLFGFPKFRVMSRSTILFYIVNFIGIRIQVSSENGWLQWNPSLKNSFGNLNISFLEQKGGRGDKLISEVGFVAKEIWRFYIESISPSPNISFTLHHLHR